MEDLNLGMSLLSSDGVRGYQGSDYIKEWWLWYCGNLRFKSINFSRFGFIEDYFARQDLEIWGQYIGLLGVSLWDIICISLSFSSLARAYTLSSLAVTMTHSQLLGHGEEMRSGEGTRKRLKISVAHFDNSALIKTYSKTLIGRCMNPAEQDLKALFTNLGNWRKGSMVRIWGLASSNSTFKQRRTLMRS